MERKEVRSTNIKSIGHSGQVMEVEFDGGTVYRYVGIDKEAFDKIMNAESIGKAVRSATRGNGIVGTKQSPDIIEPA